METMKFIGIASLLVAIIGVIVGVATPEFRFGSVWKNVWKSQTCNGRNNLNYNSNVLN
jgi:hypothetical protein